MVLSLAPVARAQDAAIAESLFKQARDRLSEGKTHEACELFARSDKVQHALGTMLNLAACHQKEGKTATAWAEFQEAAAECARTGDKQREGFARDQAAALEKDIHKIVVDVGDPAPTKVELDGSPLDRAVWGTELPLDPGPHTLTASADGFAPWTKTVDVPTTSGTDHVAVQLQRPTAEVPTPPPTPPTQPGAEQHKGTDPMMIGGISALAVGVIGFGIAIGFGADMASKLNTRDSLCPPAIPCYQQAAFDADHTARIDQGWLLAMGTVGIVGLVTGAVLVTLSVTGHKATDRHEKWMGVNVQPWASPTGGGLGLTGNW